MSVPGASDPDELIQIVDSANLPVGVASRVEVRARRLAHRASFVLVFSSSGELYLQQRSYHKDACPGEFDAAAGGLLRAGESYADNARRELAEEIGVHGVELASHGEFYFEDAVSALFGGLFSVVTDGPFRFDDAEVIDGFFVPIAAVLDGEYAPVTADTVLALRTFLARR